MSDDSHPDAESHADFKLEHLIWALSLGFLSAVSLQLGAIIGVTWSFPATIQGKLVSFGGGALLAALAVDLVAANVLSVHEDDCNIKADKLTIICVLSGSALGGFMFIGLDALVNRNGGFFRKTGTKLNFYREYRAKRRKRLMEAMLTFEGFEALDDVCLQSLVSCLRPGVYLPREVLFTKGERAQAIYFLMEGSVELKNPGATRTSVFPGQTLGEVAMLTDKSHASTAVATVSTNTMILLKTDYARLRIKHEKLDAVLCDIAAKRLQISAMQKAERFEKNMKQMDNLERGLRRKSAGVNGDVAVISLSKENSKENLQALDAAADSSQEPLSSEKSGDLQLVEADEAEEPRRDSRSTSDAADIPRTSHFARHVTAVQDLKSSSYLVGESYGKDLCDLGMDEMGMEDDPFMNKKEGYDESLDPRVAVNQVVPLERYQNAEVEEASPFKERSPRDLTSMPENEAPPSMHAAPLAIWLGILLDGIPESFVIGAELATSIREEPADDVNFSRVFPYTLIAGLFLSNFPEALSSSTGMVSYGYTKKRVLLLWFSLVVLTTLGAGVGYTAGNKLDHKLVIFIQGLAAGAMLTMICANMIPEAVHLTGPNSAGLLALFGFILAIAFKLLE